MKPSQTDSARDKGGKSVGYLSGLVIRVSDQSRFEADWNAFTRDMFLASGATRARALQNVMGGEQAGEINIACEWDSLDDAMRAPGDLRAKQEMIDAMQAAGVQTLRRSLISIEAERGTQEGEFASLLASSSNPHDLATTNANLDLNWAHMQSGANGIMLGRGLAAGPLTGLRVAITATDSADELMASSAAMFADPVIQKRMAEQNIQLVARQMLRLLA